MSVSVYGGASQGAQVFKAYHREQYRDIRRVMDDLELFQNDPQRLSIYLLRANQNLQYAQDVMGLILKNITSLQP